MRPLLALLLGLAACGDCDQSATFNFTQDQRGEGNVTLETLSTQLYIEPALVTSNSQRDRVASARLHASVADMLVITGDDASGALTLTLDNVHPEAVPILRAAREGAFSEALGADACPSRVTDLTLPGCDPEGQGTCAAFDWSRDPSTPTTLTLTLGLSPCRELALAIEPPPSTSGEDVRLVVMGASPNTQQLVNVARAERAAGSQVDFIVLLGDQLEGASGDGLLDLYDASREIGVPVIALVGDEELGADDGELFEQTFGAFQFRWTFKQVQFVNVYSARATLGARGLANLEAFLQDMAREDAVARALDDAELLDGRSRRWPALAFTYAPPFDPNGARERGFVDRTQAARLMSLLANYGVDTLFAGRLVDNFTLGDVRPTLRVTTASDAPSGVGVQAQYLRVTLSRSAPAGSFPVGDRFMTVEQLGLP